MKPLREILKEYYLEYVNNYLTVDEFAEHNGICRDHALEIIAMGHVINNEDSTEENNLDDFSWKENE